MAHQQPGARENPLQLRIKDIPVYEKFPADNAAIGINDLS